MNLDVQIQRNFVSWLNAQPQPFGVALVAYQLHAEPPVAKVIAVRGTSKCPSVLAIWH